MTITTTLTTSGNSTAVRLPKELLRMSGLSSKVTLEAKQGAIIIRKPKDPRKDWGKDIKALVKTTGDPSQEFNDMALAANDGLKDLPWNGITFEEWQQNHARLS